MAEREHHPDLMRIRNRYHAVRRAPEWKDIRAVVATNADKAEALAKAALARSPRLRVLQAGSAEARRRRAAFLKVQAAQEQQVRAILADLGRRLTVALARLADRDGKIPPGRLTRALQALKDENAAAYKKVNSVFLRSIRAAARLGLKGAMAVGKAMIEKVRAERAREDEVYAGVSLETVALWEGCLSSEDVDEGDLAEVDAARQSAEVSDVVFQRIFKGALLATMQAGLFGDTGVSNRVWDLRDGNLLLLKRLVSAGIARGESAAAVAEDIQKLLVQPETLRGLAKAASHPGVGVYRSAYRNALRLTRTETNRAFGAAQALFAEQKGWNVVWHVSDGQRHEDECDDLDGQEMSPEDFLDQYPQHPNCLCYSTLAVPDVPGENGADDESSDDEPPVDQDTEASA